MRYTIIWEVSKKATVEANNQKEAIEFVMSGEVDGEEDEITVPPTAIQTE